MKSFLHSGNIGDIIAFFPFMQELGGGHLVITNHPLTPRTDMRGWRYESFKPLAEIQPYVEAITYEEYPVASVDYDVCDFRKRGWARYPIMQLLAWELGMEIPSINKWLIAAPSAESFGKIVCHRSLFVRNEEHPFPWKKIVHTYGDRILFVGKHVEYIDFIDMFGYVEHRPTENLLEVAELIAGSSLFIGNSSAPFWIAAGMNHPAIQEVKLTDAIVPYKDALYISNGSFEQIQNFIAEKSGTPDI